MSHGDRVAEAQLDGPAIRALIADSSFSRFCASSSPRLRISCSSSRARARGIRTSPGGAASGRSAGRGPGPAASPSRRLAAPCACQISNWARQNRPNCSSSFAIARICSSAASVAGLQRQIEELERAAGGSRAPPRPAASRPGRRPAGPAGGPAAGQAVSSVRRSSREKASMRPASSLRAGMTCGPPWFDHEVRTGQPEFDPIAELLVGPVQQRPRRSSDFFCCIATATCRIHGLKSLGNCPRAVSSTSKAFASWPWLQQQPGEQQRRPGLAGRRRRRLGDQPLDLAPLALLPRAAGDSARSAASPAAPRTSPGRSCSSRRHSWIASSMSPRLISAWIHPCRAVRSFGSRAYGPQRRLLLQLGLAQLGIAPRQQHIDHRLHARDQPPRPAASGVEDPPRLGEFMHVKMIICRQILREQTARSEPLQLVDLQEQLAARRRPVSARSRASCQRRFSSSGN